MAEGNDPSAIKRLHKTTHSSGGDDTFGAIGDDWFQTREGSWCDSYKERQVRLLKKELAPLAAIPIQDIKAPTLIAVIRKIEARDHVETAIRTNRIASRVFCHGIALGFGEADPAAQIAGALRTRKSNHFAAITDPKELGAVLAAFDAYPGTTLVRAALKLTPLLLVRPGELRHMEWSEVRLDDATWTIPGPKMKRRREHLVPLARQAVAVLRDLFALTGNERWVMPSQRSTSRAMSEAAVLGAMRRMGIGKDEATPHGFRATARTLLAEVLNYPTDLIEHQLAHAVRDATGEAYNRTRFLPQRMDMMQAWADYLDRLQEPEKLRLVETNDTRSRGAYV
ncbi:MAG: site-specific integrase [Rhodospirillales bacterium]